MPLWTVLLIHLRWVSSISSFRETLLTTQENFPADRKDRYIRHFMEVVVVWIAHYTPLNIVCEIIAFYEYSDKIDKALL